MTARYIPAPGLMSRITPEGLVIITPASGEVRLLNPLGGTIWQSVAAGADVAQICRQIAAEYELPLPRATEDVHRFLTSLVERGLLWSEPQAPGSW